MAAAIHVGPAGLAGPLDAPAPSLVAQALLVLAFTCAGENTLDNLAKRVAYI
jgi:hypothetical protein